MNKRKLLTVITAGFFAVSMLAGCSNTTDTGSVNGNDAATKSNSNTGKTITLHYGVRGSDEQPLFDALFKEFMEENPSIKVETQVITNGDLPILAAGEELPDVFIMDDVLAQARTDWPSYFLNLDDIKDEFQSDKYYFTTSAIGEDGVFYGMPSAVNYTGIYYNRDIFEQAGISEMPKTKEAFYEMCQKIADNTNAIPLALGYKDNWPLGAWQDEYPKCLAGDDAVYHLPYTLNTWFSEEQYMKASGDFMRTMIEKGYTDEDVISVGWDAADSGFPAGIYAMVGTGSWFHGSRISTGSLKEDNLGYMPFPESKDTYIGNDLAMVVGANTKYPEEAKKLFLWLMKDGHYYDALPVPSIIKGDSNDPVISSFEENAKQMGVEIKELPDDDENDRAFETKMNETQVKGLDVYAEYIIADDLNAVMKKWDDQWNK